MMYIFRVLHNVYYVSLLLAFKGQLTALGNTFCTWQALRIGCGSARIFSSRRSPPCWRCCCPRIDRSGRGPSPAPRRQLSGRWTRCRRTTWPDPAAAADPARQCNARRRPAGRWRGASAFCRRPRRRRWWLDCSTSRLGIVDGSGREVGEGEILWK